jgi:hypothetical protein
VEPELRVGTELTVVERPVAFGEGDCMQVMLLTSFIKIIFILGLMIP